MGRLVTARLAVQGADQLNELVLDDELDAGVDVVPLEFYNRADEMQAEVG